MDETTETVSSASSLSSLTSGDDEIYEDETKKDSATLYMEHLKRNEQIRQRQISGSIGDLSRTQSLRSTRLAPPQKLRGHQHSISDTTFMKSLSHQHINRIGATEKKKLSLDVQQLEDAISLASTRSSFISSIGNWFRGSVRSRSGSFTFKFNEEKPAAEQQMASRTTTNNVSAPQPTPVIKQNLITAGTSFSSPIISKPPPMRRKKKKKLHFHQDDQESGNWSVTTSSSDDSSFDEQHKQESSDEEEEPVERDGVRYELRSSGDANDDDGESRQLHRCMRRSFGRRFKRSVDVTCHPLSHRLHLFDAIVIPGNSFGFLDGEPEIKYVKLLGWKIQEQIQRRINEDFDGEMLVGQSLVLKLDSDDVRGAGDQAERGNGHVTQEEEDEERMPTHVIYVAVMRVPSLVDSTVNAYLAFRAVLLAVKKHNRTQEAKLKNILCPPFCNGIGQMPPQRIAYQMKSAYEEFADSIDNKSEEDQVLYQNLGSLATKHVEMASMKHGDWC